MDSFYLAWRYLNFNKIKSVIIVICVTVIMSLPILLQIFAKEAESQLRSRAEKTPLLLGKQSSTMDLVLSSLYFTDEYPPTITMDTYNKVSESMLGQSIPLFRKFSADGFPIIGTNLDYFSFRQLEYNSGRPFIYLGEVVLGSSVAEKLNLTAGDSLFSSTDNLFDLAGSYPLKMLVSGVLEKAHTPDDHAVFADIKTTWIIAGLGHGHKDIERLNDPSVILNQDKKSISANAKLLHYNEITEKNRMSFHFHGDMSNYPLSSIIFIPDNKKSEALIKGRFIEGSHQQQIIKPSNVVEVLLSRIFQMKSMINGATLLTTLATLLALILVFSLSAQLRKQEFEVLFKLGCGSRFILQLILSEISLVILASTITCTLIIAFTWPYRELITRSLLFNT